MRVNVQGSELNQQGGHYANQAFSLNQSSPTLNLPHAEFPCAEQEGGRNGVCLAMGDVCVLCHRSV